MGKARDQTNLMRAPSSTLARVDPSGRVTKACRPTHDVGNNGLGSFAQLEAHVFGRPTLTVQHQYNSIAFTLSKEMNVGQITGHPEDRIDMLCNIMKSKWKRYEPQMETVIRLPE